MKKSLTHFLNRWVVPPLLVGWIILVGLTARVTVIGREHDQAMRKKRCVVPVWHKHSFYGIYRVLIKGRWLALILRRFGGATKWATLVSPSRDGEIMNGIMSICHLSITRGNAYRNSRSSFLSLARKVRKEYSACIVADGSRGPARKAQPGAVYLSKIAKAPIYPLAFDAKPKIELNSWDRTIFPLPFCRIAVAVGAPITIDPKGGEEELERKNLAVEEELNRLTSLVETEINK